MSNIKILVLGFGCVLFAANASAQSIQSLEMEINNLKQDVKLMQRQFYKEEANNASPQNAREMLVKVGQMDESLRELRGKLDEVDYKIRKVNERIDLLNKDVDVRIKMIEGKPIRGSASANKQAVKTFDAPVAIGAPKSIAGDSITGGELAPVEGSKEKAVQDIYQKGLKSLKANKYNDAEASFSTVLKDYPNDKLAGNAQYWLGEVYYGKGDFQRAAVAFAKGYQDYKTSSKGVDSLLKLGLSMKALKKNTEACAAFQSLPKEFPSAPETLRDRAKKESTVLKCK